MRKDMKKRVIKSLLFVLPYIIVEFTNTFLILIDKSISNSIGQTALVVFSSFITLNWAINTIHCACITVSDTLSEIISGYYNGLLIDYSNDIEKENKDLLNKVDYIGIYGTLISIVFLVFMMYPSWWFLAKTVPWKDCNPYIWFYSIEFVMEVASSNYRAYLSANKNTKTIRNMALIGGICVRIPLALLFKNLGFGLLGLSLLCGIDRIVRLIYLRIYIKIKSENGLLYK